MKHLTLLALMMAMEVSVSAKYTIHNVSGNVTVENRHNSTKVVNGMELNGLDEVVIGNGAFVEIFNSVNSKVYRCDTPGRFTATKIMLNASKSADSNLGNVNKAMRFSKDETSSKVYFESGRVTRALEAYDPEASAFQVDANYLGMCLADAIRQKAMSDSIPVLLTCNGTENPFEFNIENTLDFPVYVNIVKCKRTEGGEFEISEMGQPVGCYALLPNQALMRRHNSALADDELHLLMLAHCYFDIDKVIEKANDILKQEDTGIYLSTPDLYVIKLN